MKIRVLLGMAAIFGVVALSWAVIPTSIDSSNIGRTDIQSSIDLVSNESTTHRISTSPALEFASRIGTTVEESGTIQLVQMNQCQDCGMNFDPNAGCGCSSAPVAMASGSCDCNAAGGSCGCGNDGRQFSMVGPRQEQATGVVKGMLGVNSQVQRSIGREPGFLDSQIVPWEMFAYGEYIGPHRTPHVTDYRLRVNDELEFVYFRTRKQSVNAYQLYVGDIVRISSATDESIDQPEIAVLSDGSISLPLIGQVRAAGKTVQDLQDELNDLYLEYLNDPAVLVQIVEGDTPLQDIITAVDATAGAGGQLRRAIVSPDGTIQLPVVGSVPAVGLTLDEIRREVNSRYRDRVQGLEVTPVLTERAPRFVYVLGQVTTPGRFELVGPTTVLQAIALAEGDLQGGNLRNVVVFRRDEQWRLTATRLDLAGAIHGRRPLPSDEIYLRDSDIVLIPRKPIQRLSEAVELYLTNTLYSIFPQEIIFDFNTGFDN